LEEGGDLTDEERISQFPLFSELPQSEIRHLASSLQAREVEQDRLLFAEGEEGDHYFILVDGEVEIIKALGTADERLLAVRPSGSFLGEMSLFSLDNRHTASVRARTSLRLLEMTRDDLEKLLARRPRFALEMMRTLSQRLDESEDLTIRDLRRKNRELIKAYKELEAAQALLIEQERLKRELELARQIQESILPRTLPSIPCFDFGARIVPMAQVGGDFYDFIPLEENTIAIVVGDVADHGVPAALFMALTVTLLRAESQRSDDPGDVLRSVNRHLLRMNETGMFVTIFYGLLDCTRYEFRYARAGHELPIMMTLNGETVPFGRNVGQLVGVFPDPVLDEGMLSLPPDSVLLLFSDGITEANDKDGNLFGQERLLDVLQSGYHRSAQDLCNYIWDALEAYRGETVQHDDVTVVAIKAVRND
jgi:sigma-B regulation protein RsbU (phosphoserine phosphatase)